MRRLKAAIWAFVYIFGVTVTVAGKDLAGDSPPQSCREVIPAIGGGAASPSAVGGVASAAALATDDDGGGVQAAYLLQVGVPQKAKRRHGRHHRSSSPERTARVDVEHVLRSLRTEANSSLLQQADWPWPFSAPKEEIKPIPKKSKVVLMILEMVPLAGPLGIDRFYLGATGTGIAKLLVCVCTCLVGGHIWGFLDAILIIVNCLRREDSINSLGMEASFEAEQLEPAFVLAVIGVVLQFLFLCGGRRFFLWAHGRFWKKRGDALLLQGTPPLGGPVRPGTSPEGRRLGGQSPKGGGGPKSTDAS